MMHGKNTRLCSGTLYYYTMDTVKPQNVYVVLFSVGILLIWCDLLEREKKLINQPQKGNVCLLTGIKTHFQSTLL